MLCFTLQRYKIESNSQLLWIGYVKQVCCVSHCKDTKLKAIHNLSEAVKSAQKVVFHTAKIQNWKQFTTTLQKTSHHVVLCFTLQRYKIESNSQHLDEAVIRFTGCVSHCKDTKLKAIHNYLCVIHTVYHVVFHTAKIQNWKQFTTCYFSFC